MANFDVEKMLSEGLNKDEIWKKFDAEIKNAQDRLDQKAKAEEDKKKKEAITENKRRVAVSALKEYFRDVGYDDVWISLDKNGIKIRLKDEEEIEKSSSEKVDEALKKIREKYKKYNYPSAAQLIEAFGDFDF